jgi:hypothetical protein
VTTIAEESLDWVTFSGEEDELCEPMKEDCPNQAVALVFWDAQCDHPPNPQRACTAHRDRTAAKAERLHGRFTCPRCKAPAFLLRIEPIR